MQECCPVLPQQAWQQLLQPEPVQPEPVQPEQQAQALLRQA